MWIMIAGPYGHGARSASDRAANLRALNEVALAVWQKGHVPIIGVNIALPIVDLAGDPGLMMPISLALVDRCDACLRIGGPSGGADEEVARFVALGRPVYRHLDDIPGPVDSRHRG